MKLHTLTLVTLTALATFAALPATAATDPSTDTASTKHQGPGRNRGGPMAGQKAGPMGGMRGEREDRGERVENLDTNSDNKISKEEFLAPRLDRIDDMFARRDANGDGLIAEGEGRPQRGEDGDRGGDRGMRPGERGARGNEGGDRGQRGGRPPRPELDRDDILACAQQQVPGFDPPERPDEDAMDDRFADVDTNGDGSLSLSEITAATTAGAEKQFARLDTNGDGFISTAENDARQQDREKVAAAMRDCTKAQLGN